MPTARPTPLALVFELLPKPPRLTFSAMLVETTLLPPLSFAPLTSLPPATLPP